MGSLQDVSMNVWGIKFANLFTVQFYMWSAVLFLDEATANTLVSEVQSIALVEILAENLARKRNNKTAK